MINKKPTLLREMIVVFLVYSFLFESILNFTLKFFFLIGETIENVLAIY